MSGMSGISEEHAKGSSKASLVTVLREGHVYPKLLSAVPQSHKTGLICAHFTDKLTKVLRSEWEVEL